ncbi:concanavalin A-like lectin/glucanase domain-containing protein [Entophlyctis helioformis]|nr:concanavalin A-like lectin/glucanase domain-containing protein [Entophlyctis helioformis]
MVALAGATLAAAALAGLAGLASLPTAAAQDPSVTGNCVSGRITMDPRRVLNLYGAATLQDRLKVDVSKYDLTLDSGFVSYANSTATISVKRGDDGKGMATILSTSRYILYGRFTVRMRACVDPGVVTTFITMSERKDEIDWEIVGKNNFRAESNVFYKGITEVGRHDGKHNIANRGNVGDWHTYTIDWRPDVLTWAIDGMVVRVLERDSSFSATNQIPPNERWYPSTPSLVQFSVWDGGAAGSAGVADWAGAPIAWGNRDMVSATVEYVDIHCYDDRGAYAPRWPAVNSNPVRTFVSASVAQLTPLAVTSAFWTAAVAAGVVSLLF